MSENQDHPNRRERPAKPALTRHGIISTALDIVNSEGLDRVTMRRVASALDTGAASLYVYVRNTEDLHAQILDALIAPVAERPGSGDWRSDLKAILRDYMAVLFQYPALARMAMSTPANGPHYMRLIDTMLGLLLAGGATGRGAAWGVDLLMLHATANAAEHATWKESERAARDMSALSNAVANADALAFPNIARLADDLMTGGPERIDWNLDLLIDGVLRAPARSKEANI